MRHRNAFTLIELLVVVAIIGVPEPSGLALAALAVVPFAWRRRGVGKREPPGRSAT